jgi:hypothetical protein
MSALTISRQLARESRVKIGTFVRVQKTPFSGNSSFERASSLPTRRLIGTYRGSRDDSFGLHNQASFTPAVRMPFSVKAGRGGQRSFRRRPDHAP